MFLSRKTRRCGEIGRRKGLKIPRWQHRTGSSPVTGTIARETFVYKGSRVFVFAFFILKHSNSSGKMPMIALSELISSYYFAKKFGWRVKYEGYNYS